VDDAGALATQIVGISLVRNEERFVRQALLNVADFCDRIVVADHMSTDRTPEILAALSGELDHLDVVRIVHSAESHAIVEALAGTDTWVLAVDGDELYDPGPLARFREQLVAGGFDNVFRIRPAGLHCDDLNDDRSLASGYPSPPGRPLLGLLNLAAVTSWTGVKSQRLHGGNVVFRPGYGWDSWRHLGMEFGWADSPLRDLHLCFLARSSHDAPGHTARGRPNLSETGRFRRDTLGSLERSVRRALRREHANAERGSSWKWEKYRRGDRVTVDSSSFFVCS
jgi:glycosyltransferase involved in cell wall biosynthesis